MSAYRNYVIFRLLEGSNNVWVQFTAMDGRDPQHAIRRATKSGPIQEGDFWAVPAIVFGRGRLTK